MRKDASLITPQSDHDESELAALRDYGYVRLVEERDNMLYDTPIDNLYQ